MNSNLNMTMCVLCSSLKMPSILTSVFLNSSQELCLFSNELVVICCTDDVTGVLFVALTNCNVIINVVGQGPQLWFERDARYPHSVPTWICISVLKTRN